MTKPNEKFIMVVKTQPISLLHTGTDPVPTDLARLSEIVGRDTACLAIEVAAHRQATNGTPPEYTIGSLVSLHKAVASNNDLRRANERLEAELKKLQQQRDALSGQLYTDPMTGIPNRRYFEKKLEEAIGKLARGEISSFSVIITDLNGLKVTNDRFGHMAGDSLIKGAAICVQQSMRETDVCARMAEGGDEVGAILYNANPEQHEVIVDRLVQNANNTIVPINDTQGIRVSMSVGIHAAKPGETAAEILKAADQAMYRAKQLRKVSRENFQLNLVSLAESVQAHSPILLVQEP